MSTAQSPTAGWTGTLQEGLALIEMGRPEAAVSALTPLLADPGADAAVVHRLIAYAHVRAQHFESAAEHARTSIGLAPGRYEAHAILAQAELGLDRTQEAADAAAQVVRLAPDVASGYRLSALALTDLGRPEEAQAAARRAVALEPQEAESHAALGYALRPTSASEAAEAYENALALDPHSAMAQINLATLPANRGATSRTTPAMVRLMAEHPSAQWPVLILQIGVLRVLRSTWLAILPFWVTSALLLGEHPSIAIMVALAAGPALAGLAWHRLRPWRRSMPAGLRRFLSQMWRTLPIMPGLVVSTVVCWLSTLTMTVVNLVGSPRAVHAALVTSVVAGVASFVILHVLQRLTLPTLVARSKAPL